MSWFLWVWFVCPLLLADDVQVTEVQLGIQGLFKVGCWTNLEFVVTGPGGAAAELVVTCPDPDGHAVDQPLPPITLPANGTQEVSVQIRLGRIGAPVRIQRDEAGKRTTLKQIATNGTAVDQTGHKVRSIPQHHPVWVLVGKQPAFNAAKDRWESHQPDAIHVIQVSSLNELLRPWSEGVDGVILSPASVLDSETSQELAVWTERGGHLVIPVGDQVDTLRTGQLASWLPVLPARQGTTRNLVPLRELVPKSASLKVVTELPAAQFEANSAAFLAGQLVARGAYGKGHVTLLAVPLDQEPLVSWDASSQAELAVKLLDITPPWERGAAAAAVNATRQDSDLNPTGISDFQTQLVNVLDTYPEVRRGSSWTVLGGLLALMLLIGPLDYLMVQRVLQRPHWTWLTLPLLVLGFGLILLRLAVAANEHSLISQQIEVLDLQSTLGSVRSQTWLSFYSPQTARYDIDLQAATSGFATAGDVRQSPRLSWIERPEPGFRGMYHGGGVDSRKPRYTADPGRSTVSALPIHQWSTGGVECVWERHEVEFQPLVTAELVDRGDGRLTGTLRLDLGVEVRDWFLAYRNDGYLPADSSPLANGETFDLKGARSSNLQYILLGETSIWTNAPNQPATRTYIPWHHYDPLSQDVDTVVRIMSFHQLVGGEQYSGLHHASAGDLDCSGVVPLQTAILFGRLAEPVTNLKINGTVPQSVSQSTFIRLFLPVTRQQRSRDEMPTPDLLRIGLPDKK